MDEQEKQMGEGMEETQTPEEMPTEEKSTGAIIGAIIVVVLLVIGGLYFLGQKMAGEKVLPTPEEIAAEPDTTTEALQTQGTSDEIDAIEADLGADLGDLDAEMANIEAELGL